MKDNEFYLSICLADTSLTEGVGFNIHTYKYMHFLTSLPLEERGIISTHYNPAKRNHEKIMTETRSQGTGYISGNLIYRVLGPPGKKNKENKYTNSAGTLVDELRYHA